MVNNMDYKMTNKTLFLCVKIGKIPYKKYLFFFENRLTYTYRCGIL